MEITGLDLATFSLKPLVTHHEQVSLEALHEPEPLHVWLPCLENYLYDEKDESKINATDMNSIAIVFEENNILYNSQLSTTKTNRNMENCFDIINENNVDACHSLTEDRFHEHIIHIEQLDRKAMNECSVLPQKSDPVPGNGTTMKVVHSDQQSPVEKIGRNSNTNPQTGSTSRSQEKAVTKSPKTPRKTGDNRRRRDKANEREKQRIVVLKHAMNVLKNAIPAARGKTKMTKLEVLKLAREYIHSLREQLTEEEEDGIYQLD